MKLYNYHIALLIKRLGLSLMLFTVTRLVFYILNYEFFSDLGLWPMMKAFIIGIRFDLSVVIYFSLPFILMHILPLGDLKLKNGWQGFMKWYFISINAILLFVNLGDSKFYNFTLKRSTADIFKFIFLSDDVPTLMPKFMIEYWYLLLIWILMLIAAWFIYPRLKPGKALEMKQDGLKKKIKPVIYSLAVFIMLLGLTLLGARGGIQHRPLMILNASQYTSAKTAPLVLNTPFTIMTTYGHDDLTVPHYFTDEECQAIYPSLHRYNYPDSSFKAMNIVVILLESYSREYNGFLNDYKGYTPFLDSLMQFSMVYSKAFANGFRSIDAIPSIIAGLPPLMEDPLTTSVYNTNTLHTLAHMLNDKNYHTAFFHGGTNGTMDFAGFAAMAGFEEYYGRTEYSDDADYDGYWGIYDEPFLQFFADKLNSFEQPFFAFEFTLSSHFPYSIPEQHKGKFKEGPLRIHKVVRYTDYALKQFFLTASKMPWFKNTIFVILADHPAQSVISSNVDDIEEPGVKLDEYRMKYYNNMYGRYAIPMMIYIPSDSSFTGIDSVTVQQCDITPGVLHLLRYNKPFISLGSNIFDPASIRLNVGFSNGLYQVGDGRYSLIFNGKESISLFDNLTDPGQKHNLLSDERQKAMELERYLMAIIQQFNYRLVHNELVPQ